MSLRQVGLAMTDLGRWDEAQALLQETLNEARARGLLKPQVTCLNSLAVLADRRGDEQRGLQLHRESLEMLRRIGGQRNEATALVNVGAKLVWRSATLPAPGATWKRDFGCLVRTAIESMECAASCNLSRLALWQGDDAHALATARSALDTAVAMQARDLEVAASLYLGRAEEALGRLVPAAQAFAHSHRVALEIGAGLSFEANAGLASVAAAQGDIGGALDALRPLLSPAGPVGASDAVDGVTRAFESAAADAAAINCDPALSPALRLDIYLVLTAASDPRAAAWLHSAYGTLMAQADAITDAELRQMFLTNIPPHRKVVALWLAQCGR